MALSPQTISRGVRAQKTKKRVGRGNSSQKGTYAGRGGKGQTARSGGRGGNKLRSLKRTLQQVPKLRGFTSQKAKKETVTLGAIARVTKAGDIVTPSFLKQKSLIGAPECGVKIVATGALAHAITVRGCVASKQAVAAIEKAGGSLVF